MDRAHCSEHNPDGAAFPCRAPMLPSSGRARGQIATAKEREKVAAYDESNHRSVTRTPPPASRGAGRRSCQSELIVSPAPDGSVVPRVKRDIYVGDHLAA